MSGPGPTGPQLAATDPATSNWVGANAGSGKTHVLTQRVARLLLAGATPEKILCLTYTKAAAAEMQTRLFRMLGEWAMAGEDALVVILADLGAGERHADPERLADARRLFARALETPGGLKIQTIHAFCETLISRFPLEAEVSPRFEVADEVQSKALLAEIRSRMAERTEQGDDAFDRAAVRLNEDGIGDLADAVVDRAAAIAEVDLDAALGAHFGDVAGKTRQEISAEALNELGLPRETLERLRAVLRQHGGKQDGPVAAALPIGPDAARDPVAAVERLRDTVLTGKMARRSPRGFPTVAVKSAYPPAGELFDRLSDWAERTRDRLLGQEAAERARDLHLFGKPLIAAYTAAKTARGTLDFNDLVDRARALLTRRDARAWILFKLDQGIDHILVDEAQDTAPAQWDVIEAIADEFLAGAGAREVDRTLFVVGDEKQSIYSFQGAEPAAFGRMHDTFRDRLMDLGRTLGEPALVTSFRSAPAVLAFVDQVFADEAGAGLTAGKAPVEHRAHRAGDTGRVDLWPLVPRPAAVEEGPWWQPVDAPPPGDARERLAELVARRIAGMIGTELLPARAGRPARAVQPGDILVLVARRVPLGAGILRHLKALGVPVAGADRLKLAEEIAVQDLLALAKVALMPSDDLTLAALLRSPLCGISEETLFGLAYPREGTLWQEVMDRDDLAGCRTFLSDMARVADYLRPYEFLDRALTHHRGRERLLARLGHEAEEAIDELLAQALELERHHAPTLAGLVHWIETGGQTIRREMDQAAGQVRVMTVHGAKGLEAPVVILPDTTSGPSGGAARPHLLRAPAGGNRPDLTIWAGAKDRDDPVTAAARAGEAESAAAERRRLLYVALTRAEDWLILCGAQPGRPVADCWYDMLAAGMARCPELRQLPSPTGQGEMVRYQTGPDPESGTLPSDLWQAPPVRAERPPPVAPESRVERASPSALGVHTATGGAGRTRDTAMRRGVAVHAVLERFGAGAVAAARTYLAGGFPDLAPAVVDGILAEVASVHAAPWAASVFGPQALAEVAVTIDPPGGGPRMVGRIDRLVLDAGRLTVVDIKSDASPPADPGGIPPAYLAQLGAYVAGLGPEYPDCQILPAILWTAVPRLDHVHAAAAIAAFHGAPVPPGGGS